MGWQVNLHKISTRENDKFCPFYAAKFNFLKKQKPRILSAKQFYEIRER